MTQGNLNRLNLIIKRLSDLSRAHTELDAQQVTLLLLDEQAQINIILNDLIFRPEVNSRCASTTSTHKT